MKEITWARKDDATYNNFLFGVPLDHWSRRYEYPFTMRHGDFKDNQLTLDAAGGDAPLQWFLAGKTGCVFNIDQDADALERGEKQWNRPNIIRRHGDLMDLMGLPDFFDRVACVSVLEHSHEWDKIIEAVWKTLRADGRLILTFDVASYVRWNHNIDLSAAKQIADFFKLELPEFPADGLTAVFPEIEPKEGEPESVELKVLCIAVDKE